MLSSVNMKGQKLIMIVYNRMNLGGIQVKLIDILNELVSRRVRVILVLRKAEGELIQEIPQKVDVINLRLGENPINAFLMICKLVFLISRFKPTTIITFADHVSSLVIIAKTLLRKRNIPIFIAEGIQLSAYLKSQSLGKIRSTLVKLLYPLATNIIVLTNAQKKDLVMDFSIPAEKIIINPNWVSKRFTHHFRGATPRKNIDILFVGRLEPQKNLLGFLKIVKNLTVSGSRISAVIVGEGRQRRELEQWTKKYHLDSTVLFAGFTNNPAAYFRRAKIFLLTSLYEGQPHAVIEAMWCGLPVISLNLPGIKETITHGHTGYVVDSEKKAIKTITRILSDNREINRLSKNAANYARDYFGPDKLSKFISIFNKNHSSKDKKKQKTIGKQYILG